MKFPIYMDNHATTPLDPRVLDAMMPYLTEQFGNPSSNHAFGWVAAQAVDRARAQIAALINADPSEIIFTSGATESDNLAIKGAAESMRDRGRHIITVVTEHKAVLDPLDRLEREGFRITRLAVDSQGLIDPEDVRRSITGETILCSVMAANNEIGVLQPVAEIGAICHEMGVLFHTDAAQALGKVPTDVAEMSLDLVSLTAHKLYGPKGIGALYVRRRRPRVKLEAQMDGGGHEKGLRSGTLNPAAIVGFGTACQIASEEMSSEADRLVLLRERLRERIQSRLDRTLLNGHAVQRLPGNLNISFESVEGESLLMGLQDVAVSSGAACTTALREPSHVLNALGRTDELAYSSVRFGLGRFNTAEEVDWVGDKVVDVVNHLRAIAVPSPAG